MVCGHLPRSRSSTIPRRASPNGFRPSCSRLGTAFLMQRKKQPMIFSTAGSHEAIHADACGDLERAVSYPKGEEFLRADVEPPPNTRHNAVRTGKRYGKTSLTARHGQDLARAIAECREPLARAGS